MIYDFNDYNNIIVSFSGGKDSLSCLLFLLENGVNRDRITLWHQAIDGRGRNCVPFFDWPSTEGYVEKVADTLGVKLEWQWRANGMYGEMYRENSLTEDVYYEDSRGIYKLETTRGKETTRRKFPAKSPDLKKRWCSSSLKIDVGRRVLANKYSHTEKRNILFITGERREESPGRAKYNKEELHITSTKNRVVHHFRPVIDFKEKDVWELIEKYKIIPHPVYYLGFPRLSCRSCIFFSPDHWATLNEVDKSVTLMLSEIEEEFNYKLDNKYTIPEMIQLGKSRITDDNRNYIVQAVKYFNQPIITNDKWILPAGAFTGGGGGSV